MLKNGISFNIILLKKKKEYKNNFLKTFSNLKIHKKLMKSIEVQLFGIYLN